MKRFLFFLLVPFLGKAQFAPAAGQPGTTAIHKDSSIIVNWATACKVERGYQDISNPGLGQTTVGDSSKAIGPADVVNVVSLGDGGSATLTFQSPIKNLAGPDFCVFENSFDPGFLELAFVEVSSDGINFTRFPATSLNQNTVQIGPFDTSSEAVKLNNLAGKYIGGYGVPFDLQELAGVSGLDINAVTHVKVIDVVGCIQPQYARYDKDNNIINDLWATAFPSGGFDLDAVGVIHQVPVSVKEQNDLAQQVSVYPSMVTDELTVVNRSGDELTAEVTDVKGSVILKHEMNSDKLDVSRLGNGIYFLKLHAGDKCLHKKFVKVSP
jgi:hypothetical protein